MSPPLMPDHTPLPPFLAPWHHRDDCVFYLGRLSLDLLDSLAAVREMTLRRLAEDVGLPFRRTSSGRERQRTVYRSLCHLRSKGLVALPPRSIRWHLTGLGREVLAKATRDGRVPGGCPRTFVVSFPTFRPNLAAALESLMPNPLPPFVAAAWPHVPSGWTLVPPDVDTSVVWRAVPPGGGPWFVGLVDAPLPSVDCRNTGRKRDSYRSYVWAQHGRDRMLGHYVERMCQMALRPSTQELLRQAQSQAG